MTVSRRTTMFLSALALACSPDLAPDETSDSGTGGTDGGGGGGQWEFADIHGVANLDDDDRLLAEDWWQFPNDDDDDRSELIISGEALAAASPDATVRMTLTGDLDNVRIWDGQTPILGHDIEANQTEYELAPGGDQRVLDVEFGAYLAEATLTLTLMEGSNEVATDEVRLIAAPLVLNHHLQPAEHVFAVDFNGNAPLVSGFSAAIGAEYFTAVPSSSVGGDIWMQDEDEFGYSTAPGIRLDTIVDSIRDRGLDSFAEDFLEGPDVTVRTWGPSQAATTYDSFGNLEVSPPVSAGGVEFPFGRIYYGHDGGSEGLHGDLATFLDAQRVQAPFQLDTSWLCVGHVDEFLSFVPDPSSPKGFKMLLASVTEGYALIDSLPGSMTLPRYEFGHGFGSVGEIAGDAALRAFNEDLQIDALDVLRAKLKLELGLDETDIIDVPIVFEYQSGCRAAGNAVAMIPGMVNLVVVNIEGQSTKLFVPDPFFRENTNDPASDPMINDFVARMPDGLDVFFIDDWNSYHLARGEVHCGTNVLRTPLSNWWEDAMHLVDGP